MLRAVPHRKVRAAAAGLSFCLVLPATSLADSLGAQGSPIRTNDYTLDLFQGPVLASARVTAMGGAFAGLAEGTEGIPTNLAAASQRYPYSTQRIDYELTAGVTFPSSIAHTDFENNGKDFGYRAFVWATVGGRLQVDHWGFGAIISLQNYSLGAPPQLPGSAPSDVKDLTVRIFKVDAVTSYGFYGDQLHVGGGVRGAVFTAVDTSSGEDLLLGTYGVGAQAGVLLRPNNMPFRVGGTVRSPIIASFDLGRNQRQIGSFFLPSGVNLPWEVEWGTAVQLGPRPLNIGWTDERTLPGGTRVARRTVRQQYRDLPRQKLLLSFAMLATGPTSGAVGISSMLAQTIDRSGEKTSVTIRAGAEAEFLPNRLQLRVGSYMEPTRFRESHARLHGTTGFELRVVDWSVFGIFPEDNAFRVSGAIDAARGYFGWSLGIGSWY